MKYNRYIFLLSIGLLAASCETEITIDLDDKDPVLVINSSIESDGDVHRIFVGESQDADYHEIEADRVSVSVNGASVAVTPIKDEYSYYSSEGITTRYRTSYGFEAAFKAGDVVRIEVDKAGAPSAVAECTVPKVPVIASVDTSRTLKAVDSEYERLSSDYDFEISPLLRDIKGEDSYYRMSLDVRYDIRAYREDGSYDDMESVSRGLTYDISREPILNGGRSSSSEEDFSLSDLFSVDNIFCLFTDEQFRDGEYKLRLSVPSYMFLSLPYFQFEDDYVNFDYKASAIVKVYSLSFLRYYYLRALENMDTWGTETSFLIEPTTLPSNVEGGMGFAAVDAVATFEIKDVQKGSFTLVYTDDELTGE